MTLVATSYEHECFLVYECWLWIRSRYDMHDVGGLKVVLGIWLGYGILPLHCTSIALGLLMICFDLCSFINVHNGF